MDLSFIRRCLDDLNSTSPIKFSVDYSSFRHIGFHTIKEEGCVQLGTSTEAFLYLYLYGWKTLLYEYFIQSKLAENGLYSEAISQIDNLTKQLLSFKSLRMKYKFKKNPYILNHLMFMNLFHELGHGVFHNCPDIKIDYTSNVLKYYKENPVESIYRLLSEFFDVSESQINNAIENPETIEEVACDYFSIDQFFKLNSIEHIGKKKILDYCFAMINSLNLSYEQSALECYIQNRERQLIEYKLPQYCLRRMLVFDRMRDVLFNEFDIDNEWFGSECENFSIKPNELVFAKQLCTAAYDYIAKSKNGTPYKDPAKEAYYRNLDLLNSNFQSNLVNI